MEIDLNVDITVTIDGKPYSYEKARAIYEKLHELFKEKNITFPYYPPGVREIKNPPPEVQPYRWNKDDSVTPYLPDLYTTCYNQVQGGS